MGRKTGKTGSILEPSGIVRRHDACLHMLKNPADHDIEVFVMAIECLMREELSLHKMWAINWMGPRAPGHRLTVEGVFQRGLEHI